MDANNITLPVIQLKALNKLVIDEITMTDVKDIIHSIDINKAGGPDNISHRMLKGCVNSICEPLCIIFNHSLSEGVFPNSWKEAIVSPLCEKGDKSLSTTDPSLC